MQDDPWVHLAGATSLDLSTPIPAINVGGFRRSARSNAADHDTAHLTWSPTTAWASVPTVVRILVECGATGVSVNGYDEAASAVAAGAVRVTVAAPPVVARQPNRFTDLCRSASMSVVCDHYAQAERIAGACRAVGVAADLLLRVDVGRHRLGIRPGPDLSDLAQGVASLPGLRLAGLWVGGPALTTGVGRLEAEELSRLLGRCRASLRRAGFEVSTISASRIEEVRGNDTNITEARTPVSAEARRCTAVVAGVVGRPTRDQAVIDAGIRLLGEAATVASVREEAEVTFIGEDFTVLRLTAEAQNLAIGDLVALRPNRPVRPPSGRPVLLFQAEEGWTIETAL